MPELPRVVRWVDPEGVRVLPRRPVGTGALVLAGSSGRVDEGRARLLAGRGVLAESVRWFGGPGQPAGPWDVPVETFVRRVEALAAECDRVVLVGTSFGAEAALVTGALVDDPPAFRDLYLRSREADAARTTAAGIAVERIAEVVLVAGGDDQVWPAVRHAEEIVRRREAHGLATTLVTDPEAGHRATLPGEPRVSAGMAMRRGGSEAADRRLGEAAWAALCRALRLPDDAAP
ncbi:acyl-CoA thioester hydrolase/BAAT C-terminal domain-containing protein [Isoptericola sp. NPDC056134]|uniref:acyl-CoA thioester hydrolase/BAAT C-terminal domain-containing protein n=1 Tax=Isoptericola sp. NPDC056134 TaxID=3345723 RepID=UPI0035E6883B